MPGSKTKLLEQKIPATYLALEDVVGGIASELRAAGNDPVLNQVTICNSMYHNFNPVVITLSFLLLMYRFL